MNNILVSIGFLVLAFTQALTNGASDLGTLPSPNLSYFLCSSKLCAGQSLPWKNRTAKGMNYYENVSDTGKSFHHRAAREINADRSYQVLRLHRPSWNHRP